MKAAQMTDFGGPEVVQLTEIAQPTPASGEVLVEVQAASVNPWDVKVRDGATRPGYEPSLPHTLGGDLAGVVTVVGEGVVNLQVGQAVYGSGQGSFAEFTVAKVEQLSLKPAQVDFIQAAALPLVGSSAIQALTETIQLHKDDKILIHGGAGGIGSIAIQVAKHIGAYVATTASTDQLDFVKSLGADQIIDYQTEDFTQLVKDFDAVFDTVGGETNTRSYQVLKPGGKLVSMLVPGDKALMDQYNVDASVQMSAATTERLLKLAILVDAGAVRVTVDKTFPLAQTAAAMEHLKSGHPKGKVVIQILE